MRLLLILALLLSAIAMARPAPAEAAVAMADCHGAMVDHDAPADSADHRGALGHTCPGCAAVAAPLTLLSPMLPPALPRLAEANVWRPSIQTAPVPPPPQIA